MLLEHVPVHRLITSDDAALVKAPVMVVFLTMPVPRVAKLILAVPRVSVAVLSTPVPPLAAGRTPVTPVVSGRPVVLVRVPLTGVPSTGAVRVTPLGSESVHVPVVVIVQVPDAVISLAVPAMTTLVTDPEPPPDPPPPPPVCWAVVTMGLPARSSPSANAGASATSLETNLAIGIQALN